jgi:hypothetical protein
MSDLVLLTKPNGTEITVCKLDCTKSLIVMEIERWEQWIVDDKGEPIQVITDDPTSTYYRCQGCLEVFESYEEALAHLPKGGDEVLLNL